MSTSTGAVKTTLYNLNVLNQLAMACIESLRPEDRGTERQFWFTVAMLCVIFACSADTIRRRVETLVNTGDINETQNCVSLTNVQAFGYNTTTLYDLTVFNKLAMTFIDNPRAVEMRKAFSDVLVKHETQTPVVCLPQDYESALESLLTEVRKNKALQAERDEAIRTKAMIGSQREATAMATASAKARECKRLTIENAELFFLFFCTQFLYKPHQHAGDTQT